MTSSFTGRGLTSRKGRYDSLPRGVVGSHPAWLNGPVPIEGNWPVISLFSGAGGLDLGFRWAGFEPRLAIDSDSAAVATYRKNHPRTYTCQLDLSMIDPNDLVTLWKNFEDNKPPFGLIGGPPCQAFSVSNVHKKKDDKRGMLLVTYATIVQRLASDIGLDFFVFENVPGLASTEHIRVFHKFRSMCESAGFKLHVKLLDAGKFGIPQRRVRLIVVGINEQRFPNLNLILSEGGKDPLPSRSVLSGLPEPVYFSRNSEVNEIPYHPNHISMMPKSSKFIKGHLSPGDHRGRSFRVLTWDEPSDTVAYGHREVHIHPQMHRRLSVFEAMLLQGFPKWYELKGTLSQQIALVSNAVPPPLARGIANTISQTLGYVNNVTTEPNLTKTG